MNSIVHIPATYRFRSDAEREAEAAAANQPKATVTEPPPEQPADLDTALDQLDAELQKLDDLAGKEREFPSTIANIDGKLKELEAQDLDTLQSLEARSAQMGKYANMRVLAASQAKKVKAAIAAQQEVVLKIGSQAASLAQRLWWDFHKEAFGQAEAELNRLFHHAYESPNLLEKYKPLVLLTWLKVPDFYIGTLDTKIVRCRQLRERANKLREFGAMTFAQVSEKLNQLDRESRERAQQVRQIASEPVLRGN
jgi:hypothetical protein